MSAAAISPTGALEQVIRAVLYEGYVLYPYCASTRKNQRGRFNIGRVYPKAYSEEQHGAEPCETRVECLLGTGSATTDVKITIGFLQPIFRQARRVVGSRMLNVSLLEVDGRSYQTWMEAVERCITIKIEAKPAEQEVRFSFTRSAEWEPVTDSNGNTVGEILRTYDALEGVISVKVQSLPDNLFKLSIRVTNQSPINAVDMANADAVLRRTFASTHTIFQTSDGEFISLIDPPYELKAVASDCKNNGIWPVLVGDDPAHDHATMLASPVILYDFPKIAPNSAGDFFDGTEIDEMLSLRALTMTDDEKRELRADEFAREILERTGALSSEEFKKSRGGMSRTPKPSHQ